MEEFDNIFDINPKVSTAFFGLIGYIFLNDFSSQEQNVLGNWLMLTAQVLITNAASQDLIQSKIINHTANVNSKINKQCYNPMFFDIDYIKSVLKTTDPNHIGNMVEILKEKVEKIEEIINNL